MKLLVLSLAMLCLTGTHGNHIAQHDETQPPSRPGVKDSLKSVLRHLFVFGAEIVANLDSLDKQLELNDRLELIVTSAYELGTGILITLQETCADVDKEMNDKYPVYKNQVVPIVREFFTNFSTTLMKMREDLQPYFDQMSLEMRKQQLIYLKHVNSIIQNKETGWGTIMANVNDRIKPFKDNVRKEVDMGRKQEESELPKQQKTYKLNQEEMNKFWEMLRDLVYEEDGLQKVITQQEELDNKKD